MPRGGPRIARAAAEASDDEAEALKKGLDGLLQDEARAGSSC